MRPSVFPCCCSTIFALLSVSFCVWPQLRRWEEACLFMRSKHCRNRNLRRLRQSRRRSWGVTLLLGVIRNRRSDIWYFQFHCWYSSKDNWTENSPLPARVSNVDVLLNAWKSEAKQKVVLGKDRTSVSVVQLEREDLRKWVSFDPSWKELKPKRSRTNKRNQRSAIAKSTRERSVKSVREPSRLRNHVDGKRKQVRQKGKESLHSCSNKCYIRGNDDNE